MNDVGESMYKVSPLVEYGMCTDLQAIEAEIETHRNSPQELWEGLRNFAVVNCVRCQSGLLRDVEDFCFAVFDCLEPNVSREERE